MLLGIKIAHVALAALSVAGFAVRARWMLISAPLLQRRWVRVAPHAVDTLLLLSGVALAVTSAVSPAGDPWFAAKLAAIVVYIVAGSLALRRGRTRTIRIAALVVAFTAVAYVLAVAITKTPLLV